MRRALKAVFHATVNAGGILGELGSNIPPANKTLDDLDMQIDGEWLFVTCKYKGAPYNFAIPAANCRFVLLAPTKKAE